MGGLFSRGPFGTVPKKGWKTTSGYPPGTEKTREFRWREMVARPRKSDSLARCTAHLPFPRIMRFWLTGSGAYPPDGAGEMWMSRRIFPFPGILRPNFRKIRSNKKRTMGRGVVIKSAQNIHGASSGYGSGDVAEASHENCNNNTKSVFSCLQAAQFVSANLVAESTDRGRCRCDGLVIFFAGFKSSDQWLV